MKRHAAVSLDAMIDPLREALSRERPAFAFLHGSAGEGRDFADLDVAIWLDRPRAASYEPAASLRAAAEIADHLEGVVGVPVDVQILNDAPLTFAYHVSHGRLLIALDEAALVAWRERTWMEYFDMQPYIEEQARLLLG